MKGEYFSTHGGNPVSCAAALTVMGIIEQEDLVAQSGRVGAYLHSQLSRAIDSPLTIRGQSLISGVDIAQNGIQGTSAAEVAAGREKGTFSLARPKRTSTCRRSDHRSSGRLSASTSSSMHSWPHFRGTGRRPRALLRAQVLAVISSRKCPQRSLHRSFDFDFGE